MLYSNETLNDAKVSKETTVFIFYLRVAQIWLA